MSAPQWSPPHLLQALILLLLLPTTNMVTLARTALRRVIPLFPFRPFLLPLNLAYWPSSSNHFGKTTNVSGPSKPLHVVCVGISRVHRPAIANRYIDICNRPVQHWTISSRTPADAWIHPVSAYWIRIQLGASLRILNTGIVKYPEYVRRLRIHPPLQGQRKKSVESRKLRTFCVTLAVN